MKKILVVIICELILLCFCSCDKMNNDEQNNLPNKAEERLDNILYDVLKNYFDYYHSLSLLNLEEIATCISSLQTEDDIHYIIGQIDIAEDYEPIYSYFTFRDQAYASDIVCPEKLEESLSSYLNTKKEFLLSVKSDFEGDKLLVNNKSFMFDCERLTSLLQNLHVSSDSLKDDNVLQEYSTSLNDVIKIMTYWIDQ